MLDDLEQRLLLAVTVALQNGTLIITGDKGNNDVTVTVSGKNTFVDADGVRHRIPTKKIQRFQVDGGAGNDKLNIAVKKPATISGGDGDDTITAGAANDSVTGGKGNDVMTGGTGDDNLDGGVGTDTLVETVSEDLTLTDTSMLGLGVDTLEGVEGANLAGGEGSQTFEASKFTGNTTMNGGGGDDVLIGGQGKNNLQGGGGNDVILGNTGDDTLQGGTGSNKLDGGKSGNDISQTVPTTSALLSGDTASGTVVGDGFDDLLLGIDGVVVFGTSGNDSLTASKFNGRVTLNGGNGNDSLLAAMQLSSLIGGDGVDHLVGGPGGTFHNGGPGDDHMQGGAGTDCFVAFPKLNLTLSVNKSAGEGNDVLEFIDAAMVFGNKTGNRLDAGTFAGPVTLDGGNGNDLLLPGPGNTTLNGGPGNDRLFGGPGNTRYDGGKGTDSLEVLVPGSAFIQTASPTRLIGNQGNDDLFGLESALFDARAALSGVTVDHFFLKIPTTIYGSKFNDVLFAGEAGSRLEGGGGNDQLTGSTGNDILLGGDGNDVLTGNNGNDVLTGGLGTDKFDGGAGKDTSDRKAGESQTGVP